MAWPRFSRDGRNERRRISPTSHRCGFRLRKVDTSCRSSSSGSGDFAVRSLPHSTCQRCPLHMPKVPTRSIVLLACAGFASQAMVRVTDSLLPQIAADFGTSVGEASIVVAAYAFSHGSIQLIIGPVGDRFGKYRTVAVMCAIATVLVALCGTVQS